MAAASTSPGPTDGYHEIPTGPQDMFKRNGSLWADEKAPVLLPVRHQNNTVTPNAGMTNGTNTAFAGQRISFQLNPNMYPGQFDHLQLEGVLVETGGSLSATPAPSPYLVQSINISWNGSPGQQNQQIWADQLFVNYQNKTREELLQRSGGPTGDLLCMNIDTFGNGNAVPPSGTKAFTLSLEGLLAKDVWASAINKYLYVDVVLAPAAPVAPGSAGGTLQLQSLIMRVFNKINQYGDAVAAQVTAAAPLTLNYCTNPGMYQSLVSLSNGNPVQIPLSTFGGLKCTDIYVLIRSAAPGTYPGISTFVPLNGPDPADFASNASAYIDLRPAGGGSALGGGNIPATYLRANECVAVGFKGYQAGAVAIYGIHLGDSSTAAIDGNYRGGWVPSVNDQIVVCPGPGFTTGSYYLTIMATTVKSVQLKDGVFA